MFWIDYIGFQGFATRKKKIETKRENQFICTDCRLPAKLDFYRDIKLKKNVSSQGCVREDIKNCSQRLKLEAQMLLLFFFCMLSVT